MSQPESFDLVVLGCGTAGQIAAYACREQGLSVAIIEPIVPGGTCATRGCDAKKPFVNLAAAVQHARDLAGHGLTDPPAFDWAAASSFKNSFTDPIPDRTRHDLAEAGIELIEAAPRLTDPHTVEVADRTLHAQQLLIATGLRPRVPDMPGIDLAIDSNGFLDLPDLPDELLFVGGGYIGMEFAHAAARAGRKVIVLEKRGCPLKRFDADAVQVVLRASDAAGIDIQCDTCVQALERRGDKLAVICHDRDASWTGDLIINTTGRVPALHGLNLAGVGITTTDRGVAVDEHLRSTSHDHVWAAGDVADTGKPQLTPISGREGKAVATNLLHGPRDTPRTDQPIPTVAFTVPSIASVGLTEAQARDKHGDDAIVNQQDTSSWKINRQLGAEHAFFKVILHRQTGQVLGAHLVGPHAEEFIAVFAIAMTHGLTAPQLRATIPAYPTQHAQLNSMLGTSL
jgi:glutathione reductase (NADPH)